MTGATATLDLALVWQADEATPAVRAFLTAAEQLARNEGWIQERRSPRRVHRHRQVPSECRRPLLPVSQHRRTWPSSAD
ncbi:hypothetical protein SSOG_00932 [Streptomyces himastatinicus ATCC 53653]|uniref:Uncharacterized protein n=1 Tax=Streptomyces himastatinicus ATCC 53653 TaxID=457427 RepID=D9WFY4_9ACTN|nr:hypothetical protein SSOG_00932 [Streptomyces himastatinicus ATCC 53653]